MNNTKTVNETLHVGADYTRTYTVHGELDYTDARALCKFRTLQGQEILTAETSIQEPIISVVVKGSDTLAIPNGIKQLVYDVFLISPNYSFKLVMGSVDVVRDVSMH